MKICIVAPINERIPPVKYGGIGRIVSVLADELVVKGHKVTLLASGDSKTNANLVPIFPKSLERKISYIDNRKAREAYFQIGIAKIMASLRRKKFDVINNQFGWQLVPFHTFIHSPFVTTLQTPLDQVNKQITLREYKQALFITVSKSQRKPLPHLNYIATIYNGIDINLYDFSPRSEDYFVFLGRMSPEKGALEAMKIAKKIKVKLIMAGAIHGWDREYFFSKIRPHIDGRYIQFIGEVNDREKNKLLGHAKALLAPIQWEEPCALTFIESMACGTPVMTMRRGSASEIVVHNKTGFIAQSLDQMVHFCKLINTIDRLDCRNRSQLFTARIMADRYESVFSKLIGK